MNAKTTFQSALQSIVGKSNVHPWLHSRQTDATREPSWQVFPHVEAEVTELVRLANDHRTNITCSRQFATENGASIYLDLAKLNHIARLDETSLTVQVQAGLTATALEAILTPRQLTLGIYCPYVQNKSMGALIASDLHASTSPYYGSLEDSILGVTAVLANGRTIHTRVAPRRATGPDLARILCGSDGALAIITSVVLRMHKQPDTRLLRAYALPNFAASLSAAKMALREEARPMLLQTWNQTASCDRFSSDLNEKEAMLVVATAGSTDLAACDRDLVDSACVAHNGRRLPEEIAANWWKQQSQPAKADSLLRIATKVSCQQAIYDAMVCAAADANLAVPVIAQHYSSTDTIFVLDLSRADTALLSCEQIYNAVEKVESVAGETCPSSLAPFFPKLKKKLDPNQIMRTSPRTSRIVSRSLTSR